MTVQNAMLATTLTAAAVGTYGGTAILTATLTTGAIGLAGEPIVFSIGGLVVGDATTGPNGVATLSNVDLGCLHAGTYTDDVGVSFAGDTDHSASGGTADLTINKAGATIMVNGYSVTYNGNSHTATGMATGVGGESLSGLDLSGTTHTNVGTYASDSWTFIDVTGNYNNASGTVEDSIGQADAKSSVTAIAGLIYNGKAQTTAGGTATDVFGNALPGGDFDLTKTVHTNAGTYNGDMWSFSDPSGNYMSASGTVSGGIGKAPSTTTAIGDSFTYDGTTHTGGSAVVSGVGTITGSAVLSYSATRSTPGRIR